MKQSVLITGIVGSGKSTVAKRLLKKGYTVFELDDLDSLVVNLEVPHDTDKFTIKSQYNWLYDQTQLKDIINKQQVETTFYCGISGNINALTKLFTKVVLLKASNASTRKRLDERVSASGLATQDHEWTLSWKDAWENSLEDAGAIVIFTNTSLAHNGSNK